MDKPSDRQHEELTCKGLIENLDRFVAGELDEAMVKDLREHLAICKSCVNYLQGYAQVIEMVRATGLASEARFEQLPPALRLACLHVIQQRPRSDD